MTTTSAPRLPIVDGHLFIDNTTMEHFTTCPRSFHYYAMHKRQPTGRRPALEAGAILHSAMELRRRLEATGVGRDVYEPRQFLLIDLCYRGWANVDATPEHFYIFRDLLPELFDFPIDQQRKILCKLYPGYTPDLNDFRSQAFLCDTIVGYNSNYRQEPFSFLYDKNGKPLVEMSFSEPLVKLQPPWAEEPITVVWTGRIDLPTIMNNELWNMDLKTGTRDTGFEEFRNDHAQLGYLWALWKQTGTVPTGFIIDKVFWRPPTRTGKGVEFKRHCERVDQDRLVEWEKNTINIIQNIIHCAWSEQWPMHTKWCMGKFGACKYLDLCSIAPNNRGVLLQSSFFEDVTWNPLRTSLADILTQIHAEEANTTGQLDQSSNLGGNLLSGGTATQTP